MNIWDSIITVGFGIIFLFLAGGIGHTIGEKMVQNQAAEAGVGRYVANETNGIVRFEWIKK